MYRNASVNIGSWTNGQASAVNAEINVQMVGCGNNVVVGIESGAVFVFGMAIVIWDGVLDPVGVLTPG